MPDPSPSQRADARRNYARILAVAQQEVATHGANASLEQIARTAGVGSATVRRHFPTRHALLEAVSREQIEALRLRAHQLTDEGNSRDALLEWLNDVLTYCVRARGLATALSYDTAGSDPAHNNTCSATIEQAAVPLLRRAVDDGAVAAHITPEDLITLLVGIALATEHAPDPATRAQQLFRLIVTGLSPRD
jgi:AcrR family transcriptional regulator